MEGEYDSNEDILLNPDRAREEILRRGNETLEKMFPSESSEYYNGDEEQESPSLLNDDSSDLYGSIDNADVTESEQAPQADAETDEDVYREEATDEPEDEYLMLLTTPAEGGQRDRLMSALDKAVEDQDVILRESNFHLSQAYRTLQNAGYSGDENAIKSAEAAYQAAVRENTDASISALRSRGYRDFVSNVVSEGAYLSRSEYESKMQRLSDEANQKFARRFDYAKNKSSAAAAAFVNVSETTPAEESFEESDYVDSRIRKGLPSYKKKAKSERDKFIVERKRKIREEARSGKAWVHELAKYVAFTNSEEGRDPSLLEADANRIIRSACSNDRKEADEAIDSLYVAAVSLIKDTKKTYAAARGENANLEDYYYVESFGSAYSDFSILGVAQNEKINTALDNMASYVNARTTGTVVEDNLSYFVSGFTNDSPNQRVAYAIPVVLDSIEYADNGDLVFNEEKLNSLRAAGVDIPDYTGAILIGPAVDELQKKYKLDRSQILAMTKDLAMKKILPNINKTKTTYGLAYVSYAQDESGKRKRVFSLNPNALNEDGKFLFSNEYIHQSERYIRQNGGSDDDVKQFNDELSAAQDAYVGRWHQFCMESMSGYDNFYYSIRESYKTDKEAQKAALLEYDQPFINASVDVVQESALSVVGTTTSLVGFAGEASLSFAAGASSLVTEGIASASGYAFDLVGAKGLAVGCRDAAVFWPKEISEGIRGASYYTFGKMSEAGRGVSEYAAQNDAFRSGVYTATKGGVTLALDIAAAAGASSVAKVGAKKVGARVLSNAVSSAVKKDSAQKLSVLERIALRRAAKQLKGKNFEAFATNAAKELGVGTEEVVSAISRNIKSLSKDPRVIAATMAKRRAKEKALTPAEAVAKRDASSITGNTIADDANIAMMSPISSGEFFEGSSRIAYSSADEVLGTALYNATIEGIGNDAASAAMKSFFGGMAGSYVYYGIRAREENKYIGEYCEENGISIQELQQDEKLFNEIRYEAYINGSCKAATYAIFSGLISNAINFKLFTPEKRALQIVTSSREASGAGTINALTTVSAAIKSLRDASGGSLSKRAAAGIISKSATYAAINSVRAGFYGAAAGFADVMQQQLLTEIASGNINNMSMEELLDSAFEFARMGAIFGTVAFNTMGLRDNVFYRDASNKINKTSGIINSAIRTEIAIRQKEAEILSDIASGRNVGNNDESAFATHEQRRLAAARLSIIQQEIRELSYLDWRSVNNDVITRLFDQRLHPARTQDGTGLLDLRDSLMKFGALIKIRGMQKSEERRIDEANKFLSSLREDQDTAWASDLLDSLVYRDGTSEKYQQDLDAIGANDDLLSSSVEDLQWRSERCSKFESEIEAEDGSGRTLYEAREDLIAKRNQYERIKASGKKPKKEEVFSAEDSALLDNIEYAIASAKSLKRFIDSIIKTKSAELDSPGASETSTKEDLSVAKAARESTLETEANLAASKEKVNSRIDYLQQARSTRDRISSLFERSRKNNIIKSASSEEGFEVFGDRVNDSPLLSQNDKKRLKEIDLAARRVEQSYNEKRDADLELENISKEIEEKNNDPNFSIEDMEKLEALRDASMEKVELAKNNIEKSISNFESLTNKKAANAVDVIARAESNYEYLSNKIEEILTTISNKVKSVRKENIKRTAAENTEPLSAEESSSLSKERVNGELVKQGKDENVFDEKEGSRRAINKAAIKNDVYNETSASELIKDTEYSGANEIVNLSKSTIESRTSLDSANPFDESSSSHIVFDVVAEIVNSSTSSNNGSHTPISERNIAERLIRIVVPDASSSSSPETFRMTLDAVRTKVVRPMLYALKQSGFVKQTRGNRYVGTDKLAKQSLPEMAYDDVFSSYESYTRKERVASDSRVGDEITADSVENGNKEPEKFEVYLNKVDLPSDSNEANGFAIKKYNSKDYTCYKPTDNQSKISTRAQAMIEEMGFDAAGDPISFFASGGYARMLDALGEGNYNKEVFDALVKTMGVDINNVRVRVVYSPEMMADNTAGYYMNISQEGQTSIHVITLSTKIFEAGEKKLVYDIFVHELGHALMANIYKNRPEFANRLSAAAEEMRISVLLNFNSIRNAFIQRIAVLDEASRAKAWSLFANTMYGLGFDVVPSKDGSTFVLAEAKGGYNPQEFFTVLIGNEMLSWVLQIKGNNATRADVGYGELSSGRVSLNNWLYSWGSSGLIDSSSTAAINNALAAYINSEARRDDADEANAAAKNAVFEALNSMNSTAEISPDAAFDVLAWNVGAKDFAILSSSGRRAKALLKSTDGAVDAVGADHPTFDLISGRSSDSTRGGAIIIDTPEGEATATTYDAGISKNIVNFTSETSKRFRGKKTPFLAADGMYKFELDAKDSGFVRPYVGEDGRVRDFRSFLQLIPFFKGVGNRVAMNNYIPVDKPVRLGDVYEYPELFDLYPDIREMKLTRSSEYGKKDIDGAFDPEANELFISTRLGPIAARSVLLHELQHVIQTKEKTPIGGSPLIGDATEFYLSSINEITKVVKPKRFASMEDKLTPEILAAWKQSYIDKIKNVANSRSFVEEGQIISVADDLQSLTEANRRYSIYHRLYGEAEARAVQKRKNYTPEQREQIPFEQDLGYEANELIIAYDDPQDMMRYFVRMASRDYNSKDLPELLKTIDYSNVGKVADNPTVEIYYNKFEISNRDRESELNRFSEIEVESSDGTISYNLTPEDSTPENVFALIHKYIFDKLSGRRVSLPFKQIESMMSSNAFISGKFDESTVSYELVNTIQFLLSAAKQNDIVVPELLWRTINSNKEENMNDLVEGLKVFFRGDDGNFEDAYARQMLLGLLYLVKKINRRDIIGAATLTNEWAPTVMFALQDTLRLVQEQGKLGGKKINSTADIIKEKKRLGLHTESVIKKSLNNLSKVAKFLHLKKQDKEDEGLQEFDDISTLVERNAKAEIARVSSAMSRFTANLEMAIRSVPESERQALEETIGTAIGSTDPFVSYEKRAEIEQRNKDELNNALKNIKSVLSSLARATDASKADLQKKLVDAKNKADKAAREADVTEEYLNKLNNDEAILAEEYAELRNASDTARRLALEMVRLIKIESSKKMALELAREADITAQQMRRNRDDARRQLKEGFDGKVAWLLPTIEGIRSLIDESISSLAENRSSGSDVMRRGLGVYIKRSYATHTNKRTKDRAERISEILSATEGDASYELATKIRRHFIRDIARKYTDDDISVYANVKAKAKAFDDYLAILQNADGGEEAVKVLQKAYDTASSAYEAANAEKIVSQDATSDIGKSAPLIIAKSGYGYSWEEAWKKSVAFDMLRQSNLNKAYSDAYAASSLAREYNINEAVLAPGDVFLQALARVNERNSLPELSSIYMKARSAMREQGIKQLLEREGVDLDSYAYVDEAGNKVEADVKTIVSSMISRIRKGKPIDGMSDALYQRLYALVLQADNLSAMSSEALSLREFETSPVDVERASEVAAERYVEYNLETIATRKGLIDGVNREEAFDIFVRLIENQDPEVINAYVKSVFESKKHNGYDEIDSMLKRRNDLPAEVRQMLGEIKMDNLAGIVDSVSLTLASLQRNANKNSVYYDLINSARGEKDAVVEGAKPDKIANDDYVLLADTSDGWVPEGVYKPSDNIWIKQSYLKKMKEAYYKIFSDSMEADNPYERMEKYPSFVMKLMRIYTVMPLISGFAPAIRNYAGMIPMTLAPAGFINATRLRSTVSNQLSLLGKIATLSTKRGRAEVSSMFQEYADLGIIDSNFVSLIQRTDWDTGVYPEIRTVLESMSAEEGARGIINKYGIKGYEFIDKVWTLGQKIYSLPDNVGKIVAYESNLADISTWSVFRDAVNEAIESARNEGVYITRDNGNMHLLKNYMSKDQWAILHETAKERTWYEQPTSFIAPDWIKGNISIRKQDPSFIKKIKRTINAVAPNVGPYFFFHYSMLRSVVKNVQFGCNDFFQGIRTGDKTRMKSGLSRVLSAGAVASGPLLKFGYSSVVGLAVSNIALAIMNIGVDEDEKWQYFSDENESLYLALQKAGLIPSWYDSEACSIFIRRNKDGEIEVTTWSSTYMNPFAAIEDMCRNIRLACEASASGDDNAASDYLYKAVRAATGSLIEPSMFMSAFQNAIASSETNNRIVPKGYESKLSSDLKAIAGAISTGRLNDFLESGERYSRSANFIASMLKGASPDLLKKFGRVLLSLNKDDGTFGAAMAYFLGAGSSQMTNLYKSGAYALSSNARAYSKAISGVDKTTPEGQAIIKNREEEREENNKRIGDAFAKASRILGISKPEARKYIIKYSKQSRVSNKTRNSILRYLEDKM